MASDRKEQHNPKDKQGTFEKLDEAYAESNMEDQLLVYWNRHKNQIVLGLVAAVVVILGIQVSKWWSQKSVADRGQAYVDASDDSQKESFAEKFSDTDLGGVAYLELADKSYSDGEFSAAVPLYEKAFKAFDMVEFKQRAHLGIALARLQAGETGTAVKDLESIGANTDYPDVARAEALYHLSILDWEGGSFNSMLKRQEQIEAMENAGAWMGKVAQLQNSVPEIRKLVEAKASDDL